MIKHGSKLRESVRTSEAERATRVRVRGVKEVKAQPARKENKALPAAKQVKAPPVPEKETEFTVGEWLLTWYELYSKPNLRPTSQECYRNYIETHLVPRIGEIPLGELSGLRLQRLYQELRENGKARKVEASSPGLSPKTVRGIHMILRTALAQAVKERLIERNPTDDCKPPKVEKKEVNVIQPERIGDYLQAAANHNVLPMFYLELTSGLRRGELLALLWSDLDVERQRISVSKSVLYMHGELKICTPKTRYSIRTVSIPKRAVELLVQEHSLHPDSPYMFPSPVTGTMFHPDAAVRIHKKLLSEAGIEGVRFHDLRHTFATVALQNGVDIKTVSGMLGHFSSGFTLDTYTHITNRMQQDAAEKMGNFMEMRL